MRLDTCRADSENHPLLFSDFFQTQPTSRRSSFFSFFFVYCQTVTSHCLSLTSCERDALRWFPILDCHFIPEPSDRCSWASRSLIAMWAALKQKCRSGMFPFQFQIHSHGKRAISVPRRVNGALFHWYICLSGELLCRARQRSRMSDSLIGRYTVCSLLCSLSDRLYCCMFRWMFSNSSIMGNSPCPRHTQKVYRSSFLRMRRRGWLPSSSGPQIWLFLCCYMAQVPKPVDLHIYK